MTDPRTPVLVGVAQSVDRDSAPADALSPADMLAQVARLAIADSGGAGVAAAIDTLAAIRLFADSGGAFPSPFGAYANLPRSVATRIGAAPRHLIYPPVGGNTPQLMVNLLAQRIADGEAEVALIVGGEAQRTQHAAERAGLTLAWGEDAPDAPDPLMPDVPMISRHEAAHGIAKPVNVYPLFENALGARYGRTPEDHRTAFAAMMAPLTRVAAANPYAAFPVERSADDLITPAADNRVIAWPYTKRLVAQLYVDQAAAVLMMSTAAADRLGVPAGKRVYLHGSADTHEHILVSERVDYHSSPAVRAGAAHALAQAGITPADLAHIDLYSCFPVAVEIAADAIGLAHDDPRGLSLTGGLPFFGGPGNAYSMHGIAEVVDRCRTAPGSWGFVFANGGFLTKHSFGVYSTTPGYNPRADPAFYQAAVDAMPSPALVERPEGDGAIETWTVVHERGVPAYGVVIGRDAAGRRFLARVDDGYEALMTGESVGRRIIVSPGEKTNRATLA